jgi:Glucan phosphorylase
MLIHHKDRYRILFKIISLVIVCSFVYSDIAFALAPKLALTKPEFTQDYKVSYTLLAHEAVNKYIKDALIKGPTLKIDGIFIKVPELLKNTGQVAHVGLGSTYGRPIVYIDAKYFYDQTIRDHERNKIERWEAKRKKLRKDYEGMRKWILDPETHDEARRFADGVDSETKPSVKKVYDGIKDYIDLDSIYTFYSEYGLDKGDADVNVAAHHAGSWIEKNIPELEGKTVLSLSMEGNIPEFAGYEARNANTKGGLGAYFGDKLEGMAAIGINALGAQIGYSHIRKDGKKVKVSYDELIKNGIMEKVFTNGNAIKVRAWDEDPEARTEDKEDRYNPETKVDVYKINRGGATDYIFMSKVFDELYSDDRAHRFTQEIVFGKAVYVFMKKMGLKPDILHLNEAHTVVAAAQMRADESFDGTAIIYTNHTLVQAGLEIFYPASVRSNVDRMMYVIGLPASKAAKFRSIFLRPDGTVDFCYAAMKLADVINAVSDEHAKATEGLFRNLYGDEFDKPVVGILNGSGQTWKSDKLIELELNGRKPDASDAWAIHESGKEEALKEIEKKTGIKLSPDKPTAWAVRRLVEYKSQYPALKFIIHLMTADKTKTFTKAELKEVWFRDITNFKQDYDENYLAARDIAESVLNKIFPSGVERVNGLGMQVVVGWPAPAYQEFWATEFYKWMDLPDLKGRFVAVISDPEILKMQAIGADICITNPKPLGEACGTSSQRTGLNFGVNITIKGAGDVEWIEEYDEKNESGSGFFLGSYTKETEGGLEADNEKFYKEVSADIFEKAALCSKLFYEDGKAKWKRLMLNAYLRANDTVTAVAMEKRYARDAYLPAVRQTMPDALAAKDYTDPDRIHNAILSSRPDSPTGLLEAIKNDDALMSKAMDKSMGLALEGMAATEVIGIVSELGILVPLAPGSSNYRFGDMMRGKYDDETKTLINALQAVDWSLPTADLRESVKTAIISEINKGFVAPEGKTVYHLIEQDVIPVGQRSTIVQAVNNKFDRKNKGPERVIILNGKETIAGKIAEIRAKDANAVIDVALSDVSHIGAIEDPDIKKIVFNTQETEFVNILGVIKTLRALHGEDSLFILTQLYTVMAGMPPEGQIPVVSGVYVFNLPRIKRENINDISMLSKGLLEALTAA